MNSADLFSRATHNFCFDEFDKYCHHIEHVSRQQAVIHIDNKHLDVEQHSLTYFYIHFFPVLICHLPCFLLLPKLDPYFVRCSDIHCSTLK